MWEACKELGIESIPARVEYIDDDEATILMVNSNIQREHVLPSEKAFAYILLAQHCTASKRPVHLLC